MIRNPNTKFDLSVGELYKEAIVHKNFNISNTGALLTFSGAKTGRSPQAKRIVKDATTENIWWGSVNMPIGPELYDCYKSSAIEHLRTSSNLYVIDSYAGWDPKLQISIRLYTTNPYHALFIRNLLIRPNKKIIKPDFVIYDVSELDLRMVLVPTHIKPDPKLTDTLVGLNFTSMDMVVYGTEYAGELKKGIFTLMMYLMPLKGHLPLHSSANILGGNLCLFLGLSGTGKTTLSASSDRNLIGDDEHVWTNSGIFNIEGGCYAKCIDLNRIAEPEIFDAIRFGAVLENVVSDDKFVVDFADNSITENTRCAYPLSYISNAVEFPSVQTHPSNIVFLVCDSFGLLPPISKLDIDLAADFFTAGYTSKVSGTEVGITEPQAVFSACFGEPFLIHHPKTYASMLKEQIRTHMPNVWLLNTGWIRGPYGIGSRIPISVSRQILLDIHSGYLADLPFESYPVFGFGIPSTYDKIDNKIIDPRNFYNDLDSYLSKLTDLRTKIYDKISRM